MGIEVQMRLRSEEYIRMSSTRTALELRPIAVFQVLNEPRPDRLLQHPVCGDQARDRGVGNGACAAEGGRLGGLLKARGRESLVMC